MFCARFVLILTAFFVIIGTSGCSAIALFFSTQPPSCNTAADCFAGSACEAGACVETPISGEPPVNTPDGIGREGGTVLGPDGIELIIPAMAIEQGATVVIEAFSPTLIPTGIDTVSPVYNILPHIRIGRDASLSLPAPGCDDRCRIYLRSTDFGPFVPIASGIIDGRISAGVRDFGLFVVGRPAQDIVDAGPGPDPIDAGPGQPDAGPLPPLDGGPTLLEPCSFAADDCNDGERCLADPFAPAGGFCISEAPLGCDASCACCGTLPGQLDGGSLCLPEALCGTGVLGDTCSSSGDCAPTETSSCSLVGGAQICTAACTSASENADCNGGCCLPDALEPAFGLCAPAATCTLPVGALCFADSSCQSGQCTSIDDAEPARCSEACLLGGCGDDLCCFPTDCDGNGQCAPQGLCQNQGLVCTDTCLNDDACSGGLCDRGTCVGAAGCECLEHTDCGNGEFCALTPTEQTDCSADAGAPCCGSCQAVGLNACFLDRDCPALGSDGGAAEGAPENVAACQPSSDAGCSNDPYRQCPGSCVTVAGSCTSDPDCEGANRCIDNQCL